MTKTAFVFPGQGSQSVGMLNDFYEYNNEFRDTFTRASDAVGFDIWDLVQNGPVQKLNQTEYTQVAMLVSDVAIYNCLQKLKPLQAQIMAGHSLGEYAALVCAKSLDLEAAAKLVRKRGELMQETVPEGIGAMAAIVGLDNKEVLDICDKASTDSFCVTPANYNAIGQVVVAGHTPAVEKVINIALAQDARLAQIIPVSVPCHCSLLQEAAEKFAEYLDATNFAVPQVSVISNVDLSIYDDEQLIKKLLKEQLYSPVRWVDTIKHMANNGISKIVEVGPGRVLTGLVKRIEKILDTYCLNSVASLEKLG